VSLNLPKGEEMATELDKLALLAEERLKRHGLKGRTVTLKIKYHDFKLVTRSRSFAVPIQDAATIASTAKGLLSEVGLQEVRVRLLGITLSNFGEKAGSGKEDPLEQLQLFFNRLITLF
jgi:DNA polymerase IV